MGIETLTLQDVIDFVVKLGDVGIVGLLVYVLLGGARKWWVWGWAYEEVVADRDEWKALALSGTDLAEQAVGLASSQAFRARRKTRAEGEQ